jgi:hypothetical protein
MFSHDDQKALRAGLIEREAGGHFNKKHVQEGLRVQAGRRGAREVGGGGASPELIALKQQILNEELLWITAKRKLREQAVLRSPTDQLLPAATVRKAWRACESHWVEQLQTIARQLGARFGGKLGKEIEAFATQLHREMFQRMATDPILSGSSQNPGGRV